MGRPVAQLKVPWASGNRSCASCLASSQRGVLRINGDGATASDLADYGELLVMGAGGYVSPAAVRALDAADREELNAAAREDDG